MEKSRNFVISEKWEPWFPRFWHFKVSHFVPSGFTCVLRYLLQWCDCASWFISHIYLSKIPNELTSHGPFSNVGPMCQYENYYTKYCVGEKTYLINKQCWEHCWLKVNNSTWHDVTSQGDSGAMRSPFRCRASLYWSKPSLLSVKI